MGVLDLKPTAHVVDVLGNVIGRDQPILRMEKALEMVSLLGEEVFADENVVFFDPFCKAGELLLACAFLSCKARSKKTVLDLDIVTKEIYESNRYFGMAPDERHHRLSLRTFLGNEVSHNEKYNHIIRDGHYVSEEDGRLDQDKFDKEFKSMIDYIKSKAGSKKIVAVGNPPYQESDGGFGGSATAIYNHFVNSLMDNKNVNQFIVVIPSRWFTAGKGVEDFREKIINSNQIKTIQHFKQSKSVFPTVDVLGGVCFLHYDQDHSGNTTFIDEYSINEINFKKYDIVLDDPRGYALVEKIQKRFKEKFVSDIAWSGKPFGIRTFYFARNGSLKVETKGAIPCYSKRRKIMYAHLDAVDKNR
ncbi:MAG: Eco57I restriction-modification methylase domain-containing protein [Bacteriovoracaceae bacterium]|nr:Eco57I restriction-modification methylase domain-containing protein [Bacteriovoracaceae bacterium]